VEASQRTGVMDEGGLADASGPDGAKPLLDAPQTLAAGIAMWLAVLLPLAGLAAAIPVGWGWASPASI
jgi:stearoyl-CoA desaturase (Delta-9 desaturase)